MAHKFLEHTADVKFQATGATIEEAFISAANATIETINQNSKIQQIQTKTIKVEGNNIENLLYNFLEEFLFLLDAENFLTSSVKQIKINKSKFQLSTIITGDKASNYKIINDVKAITYNEMSITHNDNQWKILCVLDV